MKKNRVEIIVSIARQLANRKYKPASKGENHIVGCLMDWLLFLFLRTNLFFARDFSALIPAETSCRKWTFSNCYKSVSWQLVSKGLSHRQGYGAIHNQSDNLTAASRMCEMTAIHHRTRDRRTSVGPLEHEQTLHNDTELSGYLCSFLGSPWIHTRTLVHPTWLWITFT